MGIIRLRCSRKTGVLSGMDTHHRGIAGCRPLCPAAYMRFRQHFSACRWENQVACGMNYGDYPAAPRLPASTPHLRGRSPRLFQPGRARSPTGENTEGKGLWPCLGLAGVWGFTAPGGKMRRANALGAVTEKISRKAVQTPQGAGRASVPPLAASLEGTHGASGGPVRRAVRARS